jgi:hypothetical protein
MTTQAPARPAAEEFRGARQVHDRERILTWLESAERARALSIVVTKGKRMAEVEIAHLEESESVISKTVEPLRTEANTGAITVSLITDY